MNDAQETILEVRGLTVGFRSGAGIRRAIEDVSLELKRGEMLALVGESGSGKTVTSLALMGLLPEATAVVEKGTARFEGVDLLGLTPDRRRAYLGKRLSMVFQEPMTALNPVLTVGFQLGEVLREHDGLKGPDLRARGIEILREVGIPSPETRFDCYPHELSGGMRQRVMIAMAIACRPALLIADEPTTALDVTVQAQIMDLLNDLRERLGMAILFVTHNLGLVREHADRVAVMVSGRLVEVALTEEIFASAGHPYTRLLLRSVPQAGSRGRTLASIPGEGGQRLPKVGCSFAGRCPLATDACRTGAIPCRELSPTHRVWCCEEDVQKDAAKTAKTDDLNATGRGEQVLEVRDLQVWFPVRRGLLNRVCGVVKAVDGLDLTLHRGETLALVGESGCGKTTVGKALLRLVEPTGGRVALGDGVELTRLKGRELARQRRRIQMVFQDPFSSLDPRMMIRESLSEGCGGRLRGKELEEQLRELMKRVGLPEDALLRYPHQFSGGQRQRIGLARALSVQPEILVCDECTSALDVSVQAQILNLLRKLQQELGLAYLFITHDLSVVSYFADYVAVMYLGRIVEAGPAQEVFLHPQHPYTKALLSAVPQVDPETGATRIRLEGDVPSPLNPPTGCHFHPRCACCKQQCKREIPPVRQLQDEHWYRCWN